MEMDELLKHTEAFQQGMQQGREMAIRQYDKILIELWEKMDDIEKKIDKLIKSN